MQKWVKAGIMSGFIEKTASIHDAAECYQLSVACSHIPRSVLTRVCFADLDSEF